MKATDPLPELDDDGLVTPEVGDWCEQKYRLISAYAEMFATSMKKKWDCLVYVDLFSGAGRARITGSHKIVPASPLLVLDLPDKFNESVFCEQDEEKLVALKNRVKAAHPVATVRFLCGDVNLLADTILWDLPTPGPKYKVLGLCFSDPYSLKNLKFGTLRRLSTRFMDHLVLIPTMDAFRNLSRYLDPTSTTVDEFLGTPGWREEWRKAEMAGEKFESFLTNRFGKSMVEEGYLYKGLENTLLVRSTEHNLPLYRLALFSRHELGARFWEQTRKYSKAQLDLFE